MHYADQALYCLQFNSQRLALELCDDHGLRVVVYRKPPSRTMGRVWESGVFAIGIDEHLLVVALDREEPGFTQKLQSIEHAWATVYEVSHGDHAVDGLVESKRLEALVKLDAFEVDIAYDEVSTDQVLGKFEQMRHELQALQNQSERPEDFTLMGLRWGQRVGISTLQLPPPNGNIRAFFQLNVPVRGQYL
ncbi:hypothetical protein [Pseudomonas shirazica]|uniref:hypothetical protein n=1 Tax=Pseudomonas shirazica TaxID=1940636 RepID=UPI003CC96039